MWFRGVILKKRIPLLASPRGGVAASQRKWREAPYRRRRGGVPCPFDRNTTLSSQKADAAQYFLDRSATPPCGDAGEFTLLKMAPNLDSCAFKEGWPRRSSKITLP